MTDDDLKAIFEPFGAVVSAKVVIDKMSGRSRGFGFVEMYDENEGRQAISQLHSSKQGGRNITVNEARPREEGGGGRDNRSFRR